MPELSVEGDQLVVGLSATERLLTVSSSPRVPLAAIQSVSVVPEPWSVLRGLRIGTGIPGVIVYGR